MTARICVMTLSGLAAMGSLAYCISIGVGGPPALGSQSQDEMVSEPREQVVAVAPGLTEPRSRTIQITSEQPGKLRAIVVRAGDKVAAGQVLAELDNDAQKIAVQAAEAEFDRVSSELQRLENGERPEDRAIAQASFEEAEATLRLAEFESDRVERMEKTNSASDREIAQYRNSLAMAQARRDAARNRLNLSEAGARAEDLVRARAVVREAEARLAGARLVLEKTSIRSPIDGVIIYRYLEPGEAVVTDVATPILSVGDCSTLHVRVDVDEADINHVWVGQRVFATARAFGDEQFSGKVIHVEPTLGSKNFRTQQPTERIDTRIREVVVRLDNAGNLPVELQMTVSFLNQPHMPMARACK
jgi:HlyD family secretion protein